MENQLQIALAVAAAVTIVLGFALLYKDKPCQPVMETSRAKGTLVTGNKDYKENQVTVIAVQETVLPPTNKYLLDWLNQY